MADRPVIVTFFEQYGAGASRIAPRVAERLGIPFVEQAISSEQMESIEAADHDPGPFMRFLMSFGGSGVDDGLGAMMGQQTDYELVMENTRAVLAASENGGVVLGRNATIILRKIPTALHVKLSGPLQHRVSHAAAEAGIDLERAAARQQREDRVRAELSQRLYRWDPRDDGHFDLVVNTGSFPMDDVVDMIVDASHRKCTQADASVG